VWHELARHCPLCGSALVRGLVEGRERQRCGRAGCAFVLYLNPASAAAGVVLDEHGRVLLVRRACEPHRGCWALPAGYQELDEHPSATVVREIREETGLEVRVLSLLELLFIPDDPRRPANVAVYLCSAQAAALCAGTDVLEAAWFELHALPEPMGFADNRRILEGLGRAAGYAGPARGTPPRAQP